MADNNSVRMQIKNVRLSWPNLWQPRVDQQSGRKTYGATLVIPKDHPQMQEVKLAIRDVRNNEWKDPAKQKRVQLCIRDGEEKADYDGFDDTVMFIPANRNADRQGRPTVLDANKAPLTEEDGRPYAGCYVNAIVEFYAYVPAQGTNHPPRVCACLEGVQFYRDGEAFGGARRASADDFDDVTGDDGVTGQFEEVDEVDDVLA